MTANNLPYQTGSSPTTAFTKSMTDAFNNAVTVMNNSVGSGQIDNLSISQLTPIIAAFQSAYDIFLAAIIIPANTNLDATPSSDSVVNGWKTFAGTVNNAASESDINIALGYIGRILQNLIRATG